MTTPQTPAKRVRFTPTKKLGCGSPATRSSSSRASRVLREIAGNRAFDAADAIDGRIASGLERPDVFNWFTHVREVMETSKPRAVVLMFGGNDDHGFMTGDPRRARGRDVRKPDVARRVPPPRRDRHGHGDEQRRLPRLDRPSDLPRRRSRRCASTSSTRSCRRRRRSGRAASPTSTRTSSSPATTAATRSTSKTRPESS